MKQRNHLLKARSLSAISPWEHQMVLSGNYLIETRERTLSSLSPFLKKHLLALSKESDQIQLEYKPSLNRLSQTQFESWRDRDMRFGTSLNGPHKDDLSFVINNASAKSHASEGQKRSCLSALKLSEAEKIATMLDTTPLICLDDFGVHLDAARQEILKKQLNSLGQVFVTAPSVEVGFPSDTTLFHITDGKQL